jgi:hypothetical protein
MKRTFVDIMVTVFLAVAASTGTADDDRWWPVQKLPCAIVCTTSLEHFPAPHGPHHMLVQSVAGLAAKAANAGTGDEMVWVTSTNRDLEDWYHRFIANHPQLTTQDDVEPWELVDRFTRRGIIRGYILYTWDKFAGRLAEDAHRPDIDCSVNVATSLAGLIDGVLIDERLEPQAQAHGLKMLVDARGKTAQWCFDTYRSQFNRRLLCMQDPQIPNCRDLAIAHGAFTHFGLDNPAPAVMQWLDPLSPILGWPGGDEFQATRLSTVHGHIQTATNWCMNLPVLMAGSEQRPPVNLARFDPRTIDFSDHRSAVSFVSTDGDNVQWYEGGFFRQGAAFWGNAERGRIPFGWSCCFSELTQLCPQAIDYALETRTANDRFVEWGGGYYYPDLFGLQRPNRWQLLADHARRTGRLMSRTGTRIIGFNVWRLDSPDTVTALETIAREMDGLLAILAFQYAPYEAGAGRIIWVKDRTGNDLPVVTARYSMWANANDRPRCGTPAKIAREIRDDLPVTAAEPARLAWVITHVWSYFRQAPGGDENAENLVQDDAAANLGTRGYAPVVWCADRLPPTVRVVDPEELIWRIRMQHAPEQTRELMRSLDTHDSR